MMKAKSDTYWDADELEALREILLEEDREAITYLAEQVVGLRDNPVEPEVLRRHLQAMLPEALAQENHNLSDEKAARWGPLVVAAIKHQAEESPTKVVAALHPLMGELIRAYLSASVRKAFRRKPVQPADHKPKGPTLRERFTRRSRSESPSTPPTNSTERPWHEPQAGEPYTVQPQQAKQPRTTSLPGLGTTRTVLTYLFIVVLLGALITIPLWWYYRREPSPEIVTPETALSTENAQANSSESEELVPSAPFDAEPQSLPTAAESAQAEIDLLLADTPFLYELNQQGLPDRGRVLLDRIAPILKKYPSTQLEIHVYTDNLGPDNVNKQLSKSRADSIGIYLSTNGRIPPYRLIPTGHGSADPVSSNDTPTGRRANRRAEFRVTPGQDALP